MSSTGSTFLDLPWEIRSHIYQYIFAGAQITLQQEPHQPIQSPITHVYRNANFRVELLRVCKTTQAETLPLLAGHASLLLLPEVFYPNEAVKLIPSVWLARIQTVLNNATIRSRITHVLRQQHLDPAPFLSLRTYRVALLVYPDWRDSAVKAKDVDVFVQSHLETEFFFQASTLRLFTRARTYSLTTTIWLLRAFIPSSVGWEIDFSLDSWTVTSKRKARFHRREPTFSSLIDDPKCRDFRNYKVEYLES